MSTVDRLMLAELAERPPRIAPPLPDVPAANDYPFHGSATLADDGWRARALAAEQELVTLRRAVARAWRPHT